MKSILIKGGYIFCADEKMRELKDYEILIEGPEIKKIAKKIKKLIIL